MFYGTLYRSKGLRNSFIQQVFTKHLLCVRCYLRPGVLLYLRGAGHLVEKERPRANKYIMCWGIIQVLEKGAGVLKHRFCYYSGGKARRAGDDFL